MEYRKLGSSDIEVSRLCLGTMTFGDRVSEDDSIRIIHEAMERGINFIDTAHVYIAGESERVVGKALKGRRENMVLASKCGAPDGVAPKNGKMPADLSPQTMVREVEESLDRLGTDYLDVLYLHMPDWDTPLKDIVTTLGSFLEDGKIRAWGASNFPAWYLTALACEAQAQGIAAPVVTENAYNVITRSLEDELVPCIEYLNIGLTCYNPLAGGLLTGKHANGYVEGSRLATWKGYAVRYGAEANLHAVNELVDIAARAGATPVQLSYQWLLSRDFVTSIILGASSLSQFESNLDGCLGTHIEDEQLELCTALWEGLKGSCASYHY